MRRVSVFLLTALVLGCGVNEVTVEIKGGDGNPIRLDANDLEFGRNRLVSAGTFIFPKMRRGTYSVGVVAGTYQDRLSIEVKSAPISGVEKYLLTFELPPGSNTPSERSGTIVFSSSKTNIINWDLFTVKADGSDLTQLTTGREFEQHPTWSPDGKSILFTRGEVMTNIDIYVMGEDGSDPRRLTEHPERDNLPAWSPDGSQIAFVSQRDGDVAVWVMDADGQNKRKLVKGRDPAWSPDGSQIAFVSGQFDDSDEIYLIRADGTDRRQLTENKKFDWFPAWSPSGDRLVFCSERSGGQELILATAEGAGQTRVTMAEKTYEQEPEWAPDGRALAYSGKMNGNYEIYVVDTSGFDLDDEESLSTLPLNLTNSTDRDDKSPSWRSY
jgi:Tol biopolymer transport system component